MVYSLNMGGIEHFWVNLYKYINRDRFAIDFITKRNAPEYYDDVLKKMGGTKIALSDGKHTKGILQKAKMLLHALRLFRSGYDIAYFNISSPADALKYPLISILTGTKTVIVHAHSAFDDKRGMVHNLANKIGRSVINKTRMIRVACSDKAAKWMYGDICGKDYSFYEIKNGIDTAEYVYNSEARNKVREEFNISDDVLLIGCVGRIEPVKNHDFLLDVFAEVSKKRNAMLMIVGNGTLISSIRKKVAGIGVRDKVIFTGSRDDVCDLLQGMDLFVMPSIYEGLPLSGVEAQASGLKCFFSDTISRELDLTHNCVYLPLDKEIWIKEMLSFADYDRLDSRDYIISAGYDIKSIAVQIEKIFLRQFEK